jgi:hypothetical protein
LKKLLAALSLLVLALVAWLALGGRREHGDALRSVEPGVQAPFPSSDGPSQDVEDPAPTPQGPESRRIASVEDLPAADAVASLLVVQAADGRPVRGADVAFVDLEDLLPEEAAELVAEHPLCDRALRARTDERGRVPVPRPRGVAWATASLGDLVGFMTIPAGSSDARLELRPVEWASVRVLRHDGSAAVDMTVELRPAGPVVVAGESAPEETQPARYARERTDERGIARLRCPWLGASPPRFVFPPVAPESPPPSDGLWIAVDVVAVPPVGRSWNATEAGSEPVELRLPALGSLEVRVVGSDRLPLMEDTEVFLLFHASGRWESDQASVRTTTGSAIFDFVQIGLDLDVTAIPLEGVSPGSTSSGGPRSEGEHVTLEVEAGGAFASLEGRLVDEQGAPLARALFEYVATPGTSGVRRTDAHGRFALGATAETTTLELSHAGRAGTELRARIELGTLRRGARDLGDVRLLPKRD